MTPPSSRPEIPSAWRRALGSAHFEHDLTATLEFVARERTARTVYPPAAEVFAALEHTGPEQVRAVILGQDPYHGPGQAHGLAFSVAPEQRLPASLRNLYRELHDDLGIASPATGCLLPWARQGVLLLNTVLTVRAGEPGSHAGRGWESFTDAIIGWISASAEPTVFLLWGNHARAKARCIDASRHTIVEGPHPSPLSAYRGFFGSRPFSRTNDALAMAGRGQIDWRIDDPR